MAILTKTCEAREFLIFDNRTTLETLYPENDVTNGLFAIITITCCLATAVIRYNHISAAQNRFVIRGCALHLK